MTRDVTRDCGQAMRQLLDATGADGYNGDTMVTRACPPLRCHVT
jgi:hypothetical protein